MYKCCAIDAVCNSASESEIHTCCSLVPQSRPVFSQDAIPQSQRYSPSRMFLSDAHQSTSFDQGHPRVQGQSASSDLTTRPISRLIRADRRRRARLDQAGVRCHPCFIPRGRLLRKTQQCRQTPLHSHAGFRSPFWPDGVSQARSKPPLLRQTAGVLGNHVAVG